MFRVVTIALAVAVALFAGACGNQIGDDCQTASDCSPTGGRICDTASPGGYCTVAGCDFDTCPDEAVCVRFFPNAAGNVSCTPSTVDNPNGDSSACSASQICSLAGVCVERSAEVRFCMKRCGGNGDCRDDYECRDEALMIANGGEPVPDPGQPVNSGRSFCGASRSQGD